MSNEEDGDFSFDLNSIKLEDIQLDPNELAEFGLLGDGEGDLKELRAMAEASPRSAAVQGNFRMIRAQSDADGDYNIDNVQLTAEDLQDPDLLRELGKLSGENNEATPSKVQGTVEEDHDDLPFELKMDCDDVKQLERYCQEERLRAVKLKQAGDQEGARAALRCFKSLQSRLGELTSGPPEELQEIFPQPSKPISLAKLKKRAIEAKRAGNLELVRELMAQIIQLEQTPSPANVPALSAVEKVKVKQIIQQIGKQVKQAVEAAKVHLKTANKTEANLFVTRKKAFEADLMTLKTSYLGNKPALVGRNVDVVLPIDLENVDVAEDELKVLIHSISESARVSRKSKENLTSNPNTEHHFKVVFAWPPENTEERPSSIFKAANFPSLTERFSFSGILRDLKGVKFFEHQKLRLDLYKKETSFLRSKQVSVGSAHVRLAPLLTQPTLEAAEVELLDEARKAVGLSVSLTLKLRRPISPKAVASRTVQWTVFDELNSGRLFSLPGQEAPVVSAPASPQAEDDPAVIQAINDEVNKIQSHAVVEHELGLLSKNPATLIDPLLSVRQLALEAKKDTMELAFQTGEISFEEYFEALQKSMAECKALALAAKREGDIEKARHHMSHIQIIEKEIASANDE